MASAFIVTTGRIIKVDACTSRYHFERTSERPGCVTLRSNGQTIDLPVNEQEREAFVGAYRRACAEDVGYRKSDVETAQPEGAESKP